jgi:uncharacterized protein
MGELLHAAGAVGVIVEAPLDGTHSYRVRFADGTEGAFSRQQLSLLKQFKGEGIDAENPHSAEIDYYSFVIYRCVVGSRAYGLEGAESDTDRRGIYLPPAELHWSLYGVPEQLENPENEEAYWELQKFLVLALKANPNILECLYTPLVEFASPEAKELLAMRESFLSKVIYQTYNGYVMSQFKKLEQDLRARGEIKWKHAMHLIRLLLSGVIALKEAVVPVRVGEHREQLLAIKRGELAWREVNAWRLSLHMEFDAAYAATKLPERPDYEKVNGFLVRARRSVVG